MADIDFGAVKHPPTDAEKLTEIKRRKIRDINAAYTEEASPLIHEYPEIEQQTWMAQELEASAYLAWHDDQQGDAPATPVLDNILAGRNGDDGSEAMFDLCVAVMGNAEQFAQFQFLTGKRQRLVKAAKAASTVDTVEGISW